MSLKNKVTGLRSILSILTLGVLMLTACSGTKYLSENESLYTGAEIQFESHKAGNLKRIRSRLEEEIRPQPNTTILGMRPGLWLYFIAGEPKKDKGFRYWLKNKVGERPVLMRDADPGRVANILQGTLFNNGYFDATVEESVVTKRKKSKVVYAVSVKAPFRLREVNYPDPRDGVYQVVVREVERTSLIKPRRRYSLDRFREEQSRTEQLLENYGFYYFDDKYVIFEADTTVGTRQVDVDVTLTPGVPDKAKRIYSLDRINVFTDYSISADSTGKILSDTTRINGYNYIDRTRSFRPEIITNAINLRSGYTYSSTAHDYTLSHLMSLGVFKFVNIRYNDSPRDSASLNASIFLTPMEKKSIRLEFQTVSKSNNFVGPGITASFTNRNFLRGAERFELSVNSAYEVQISRQQTGGPLNALTLGAESSLTVPRFISPFNIDYYNSQYIPHTYFSLGFNLQRRIDFFQLSSFNAMYGYRWRETTAKNHELYLADINYVQLSRTSPTFSQLLERNPVLANSVQNQFIIGTRYSFTLNTQLKEEGVDIFGKRNTNTHNFYFNGNIGAAGNLLNYLQETFNEKSGSYEIFGTPYSQYLMADVDFRHYWQMDRSNKLVTRLMVGVGYPYGNSSTLPYIKQYAAGGSNSIRAFPARSLGPGTYDIRRDSTVDTQRLFIDQRGDIKLEGNVEYRFDIIKVVKGALFVDAGNIWLWREDPERRGGKFDKHDFIQELAVGTGAGLRFDFNFFVIRFDVAFPVRKPLPQVDRWVFDEIDFGSKYWRRENLVYNLAIGYPF